MASNPQQVAKDLDRRNLDLARQVLEDRDNPQVAHLVQWALRVVARLEGRSDERCP